MEHYQHYLKGKGPHLIDNCEWMEEHNRITSLGISRSFALKLELKFSFKIQILGCTQIGHKIFSIPTKDTNKIFYNS